MGTFFKFLGASHTFMGQMPKGLRYGIASAFATIMVADGIVLSNADTLILGVMILVAVFMAICGLVYTEWTVERRLKASNEIKDSASKQLADTVISLVREALRTVTEKLDTMIEGKSSTDTLYAQQAVRYSQVLREFDEVKQRLDAVEKKIGKVD